ncbi:MAG TPA: hypothetical protein VFS76_21195 [Pyrinomonadaceae bacterium]|nr:hypothetical protein [Pyrinomonadaceae bacterium]
MSSESESSYTEFEWYRTGKWNTIQQGDLLSDCPVPVPSKDLTRALLGALAGQAQESAYRFAVTELIVVSQSCDLLKEKVDQVLLCEHVASSKYGKETLEEIRKERRPNLHMIEACEIDGHQCEQRVIDFRTVYTLPKDFVLAFIKQQNSRLRLMPPYREHMAQAFARYFMRVGLPRNLKR